MIACSGMAKKTAPLKKLKVVKKKDVPATAGMLAAVRSELKHDITGVRIQVTKLDAKIDQINVHLSARMDGLEARMDGLEARMGGLEAKMDRLEIRLEAKFDAKFKDFQNVVRIDVEKILAIVSRSNALIEEQNARNAIVLDGFNMLLEQSKKHDARLAALEKKVFGIESA